MEKMSMKITLNNRMPFSNPILKGYWVTTIRYILYGLDIEKGIRIEYLYNFGLPVGNSAFDTTWLEFDFLVSKIKKNGLRLLGQTVESEFVLTGKFM